jgi:hypothetical protein
VLYGDGTTVLNQTHEARSIGMKVGGKDVIRYLGAHKAASHTAQAQFDGWLSQFQVIIDILKRSPLNKRVDLTIPEIASKLKGLVTDHAADQKLLSKLLMEWKQRLNREERGRDVIDGMTLEAQTQHAVEALDEAISECEDWEKLTPEEQCVLFDASFRSFLITTGEVEHESLSPEEQANVDLFLWHGCCMHKDLNATRSGDVRMRTIYKDHPLIPSPIPLKNKWQKTSVPVATPTLLNSEADGASCQTEEFYACGGTKLTTLAGAIFNHKDAAKGVHKTVQDWFILEYGHAHVFPDTSNVRYCSHCQAAIELLVNRHLYIRFLNELFNAKTKVGFTSIEQNLFDGLNDWATLSELAVLALYSQLISIPYIEYVRSYTGNALDLGSFHNRLKAHISALIASPEIALGASSTPENASFLGLGWNRPDVVHWIWANLDAMPHLETLFVEFLRGALEAWERFTSEYASNSLIAKATPAQKNLAFSLPTNDISESALGVAKQAILANATLTDRQRNSKAMRRYNTTEAWVEANMTPELFEWARREARMLDSDGTAVQVRVEMAKAWKAKVAANKAKQERAEVRREAAKAKLAATDLIRDPVKLNKLNSDELGRQIDKWRSTDSHQDLMPAKSKLRKAERLKVIKAAIERDREALQEVVNASAEIADAQAGVNVDEDDEDDDEAGFESSPSDEEMEN